MFSPTKRVAFQERLVEFVPTPVIEGVSDNELETSSSEDEHKRRREVIEAEDGHSTPIQGRRKKREWVWRPVEDDILTSHDRVMLGDNNETTPFQVHGEAVNVRSHSVNKENNVPVRQA